MEPTMESQRRLQELIPNAEERGALRAILLSMSHEQVVTIFNDDDDAVRASLQQLLRQATVARNESLISTLRSFFAWFGSLFPGGPTPEPTRLLLLPPPAVAEPLEHVRTWREWFLQMYDYMLTVGRRICATASSAFDAVGRAVRSAVNSFMELLQRTMESISSFLHSIYLILERLVSAILGFFPAYHAHHT